MTITPPAGRRRAGARARRRTRTRSTRSRSWPGPSRRSRCRRGRRALGGRLAYRYDPEWVDVEPEPHRHRPHLRRVRGTHGLRRPVPLPVLRAERRLAGERPPARRHHHRVRVADRRHQGRRLGRVPRHDDRVVQGPADRGRRSPATGCARGTSCGAAARRSVVDRERVRGRDRRRRHAAAPSEIRADGRFSLGYPRKDGGEEIDARVIIKDRPLTDLRHAFQLDDWPVDGKLSGEYHLSGKYTQAVRLRQRIVMHEHDRVEGAVRREHLHAAVRRAGRPRRRARTCRRAAARSPARRTSGGTARYSFNADGDGIPVESITAVKFEKAPLSGVDPLHGQRRLDVPRPRSGTSTGAIEDVYLGDEGIGLVTGHLGVPRQAPDDSEFEAASPRWRVSGTGQVEMTPTRRTPICRSASTKTSLDPYVRVFEPRLSPFTRAEASGTIRVVGQLADPGPAVGGRDGRGPRRSRLFDYDLKNDGPIRIVARPQRAAPRHARRSRGARSPAQPVVLVGKDTRLELSGTAAPAGRPGGREGRR